VKKYEEVLVPLIMRNCPRIKKYVRTPLTVPQGADGPGFDCINEVWYEDREAFKAFALFAMSEDGKVIFETGATFMDTSKTVAGLVQETTTS